MKVSYDHGAYPLSRAYPADAGMDIRSPLDYHILPFSSAIIPTGVHVQLPEGTFGLIASKSGLNIHHGITSEGIIDEGYGGEIIVKLYNFSPNTYDVKAGDKVSQLIILDCRHENTEVVDCVQRGERGNNGFGSTGR